MRRIGSSARAPRHARVRPPERGDGRRARGAVRPLHPCSPGLPRRHYGTLHGRSRMYAGRGSGTPPGARRGGVVMTATTSRSGAALDPVADLESRRRRAGWAMALRGIIAVIFGLIALRYPGAAMGAFLIIFAVFAFADAILEFATATALGRLGLRWGLYVVGALASTAAGVLAIAYPRMTFLVLVLLVGARAIAVGIVEMA